MIILRSATPADVDAIASLLAEMDRFYGTASVEPADDRVPVIRDAIFATPPAANVLLAWKGAALVGLAAYSFLWPAVGVTRSLYLKELFVAEPSRREGVGHLLMRELCAVATATGCSRVEWTADADNPIAQRF